LTHAADNLAEYSANLVGSRSVLLDADYAKATGELARTKVVDSAASMVLKQATENQRSTVGMIASNSDLFGA